MATDDTHSGGITRRDLMSSAASVAAVSVTFDALAAPAAREPPPGETVADKRPGSAPSPPFDSLRDYVAALEHHGLLRRFSGVDQDRYEATAIMYQLANTFGEREAPAVWFDNITANGRTYPGPVVSNLSGHWDAEAIIWGLPRDPYDATVAYRAAKQMHLKRLVERDGDYAQIEPVEIASGAAPCKAVRKTGDAVDVTAFPFIKGNDFRLDRFDILCLQTPVNEFGNLGHFVRRKASGRNGRCTNANA